MYQLSKKLTRKKCLGQGKNSCQSWVIIVKSKKKCKNQSIVRGMIDQKRKCIVGEKKELQNNCHVGGGGTDTKIWLFSHELLCNALLTGTSFFFSPKGKYRSKKINTLNPNSEVSSFWIKTLNVHKKYFVQLLLVSCIGSRKKNKNIVHPEEMVKVFFFYYLQRVSLAERSLHVPFPFY